MTWSESDPVPAWVHMAEVPPDTDDEPWTAPLSREQSRDITLACMAGMVLLAIAAFLAGRASA